MFPPAILSKARQLATVTPVCFPAARSWAATKCLPVLLGSAMSDLGARHLTPHREGVCSVGSPSQLRGRAPVSHCNTNTLKSHSPSPKKQFSFLFFLLLWHFGTSSNFWFSEKDLYSFMKAPLINRKEWYAFSYIYGGPPLAGSIVTDGGRVATQLIDTKGNLAICLRHTGMEKILWVLTILPQCNVMTATTHNTAAKLSRYVNIFGFSSIDRHVE